VASRVEALDERVAPDPAPGLPFSQVLAASARRAEDPAMQTVHEVRIEPLTEEAFAPFGQIISTKRRAPDFRTESGTEGWAVDFRAGRPLLLVLRTAYQGLRFSKLERHFQLTQTFLPLGGSPAAVAVAPSSSSDRSVIPDPTEVRAFLLDGTQGYALAPGTWHSLDRFPLYPPDTRWVIVTDHETQEDLLIAYSGKGGWQLTQEADYRTRFDLAFALTLGGSLTSPDGHP
jgi:ureidoglycolate lyase